jgi:hypothetical protein
MARRRRRRRPGGHTTAIGSGGRRAPISTDTDAHTHSARSLACPLLTLSSARPFSNGIFRSNGAPASLPPASSSLTHARRMDGFCNQNADQLCSLAGPSLVTVYVGVVECAPASLPPASSSLTHARRMDGFCNQNADQLGSLAGPSLLTVYVGVVACAPASPYTYSSSTHRFPDERTPIEATPLSATSAELGLGLGLGLGLDSLSHSSSHALPFFFSPPASARVSHSTCSPLSSSAHAHSFVLGTAVINTHTHTVPENHQRGSPGRELDQDCHGVAVSVLRARAPEAEPLVRH